MYLRKSPAALVEPIDSSSQSGRLYTYNFHRYDSDSNHIFIDLVLSLLMYTALENKAISINPV